jgi:CheY-like chemotaxis protein
MFLCNVDMSAAGMPLRSTACFDAHEFAKRLAQLFLHLGNPLQAPANHGASFKVYLPVTGAMATIDPQADPEAAPGVEDRPAPESRRRARQQQRDSRTILLVEDEEDLRLLLGHVLDRGGYQTVHAPDALRALEIWRDRQAEIDVVLSDLQMPGGLNGRDMAEQMLAEKPDLKVIFMSGYSRIASDSDFLAGNRIAFLPKPFQPHQLLEIVRHIFDSSR